MLGSKLSLLKEKVAKKKSDAPESKAQHLVGLDIGTEFVKAVIARINGDQLTVVGTGRVRQHLADMQAGAIADITAVVANCEQALSQAESASGISARSAVIGIAGELVQGITTTVRVNRKDGSKPLDLPEIDRVIKLIQERASVKAKEKLTRETGGKAPELKLVNSALVSIEIDGYTITNPIGFQGKEITVQLYTAFAPQIHIGALEKTAAELDIDLVAVAAEPFGVARSVIGNDPNANMSAILIDIGGGTTDIAVVNEGGVEGTKMFAIGGRVFTKSIERDLNVDYVQAEALKVGLSDGRTPTAKKPAVEEALKKTLRIWLNGIELALSEFTKIDHLPNQILLCGGGASLEMLQDALREQEWYKSLPFTKKPTVKLIDPKEVVSIVDSTGDIDDHTYITALGLLRVGADTLGLFELPGSSIRERLNRLLSI
jgi:cell division protein FtsA